MNSAKKKMGRPSVDSDQVRTRMHRDLLNKLDSWRDKQPDKPSRPEAVRRLVQKALKDD